MCHQNDNFAVFISIWLSKSSIAQLKTERCNYIIYSSMKCYRLHQITCWTKPIGQFGWSENTYSLDLPMSSILKSGIVSGRFTLMLWPVHSRMFRRVNLSHVYLNKPNQSKANKICYNFKFSNERKKNANILCGINHLFF